MKLLSTISLLIICSLYGYGQTKKPVPKTVVKDRVAKDQLNPSKETAMEKVEIDGIITQRIVPVKIVTHSAVIPQKMNTTYKIISTPEMKAAQTTMAKNQKSLDSLKQYERPALLAIDTLRVRRYQRNIGTAREQYSNALHQADLKARAAIKK